MKLFGKKKDEEEEEFDEIDELDDDGDKGDRKLKRKLKDLHPENKKKRKEPPKPWGKKERFIVGGFFLFTTISATIMFLYSHDYKLPGLPRIILNGFNFRNPLVGKVIEVGQKENASVDDHKAQLIVNEFKNEIVPLSGHYGFLVTRLKSGEHYGVSNNEKFQGASLLKLPLIVLMYKMNQEGTLDLDNKYILKGSDKVKGSGVLYTAKVGTSYTYRKLAEYMGKNSDRTAYKVMKDLVGEDRLKSFISEVGMQNTNINTGETSPTDIGILLQKLWDGGLVSDSGKNEIFGFLTNTIYEKWITKGVPTSVPVIHKFGQDGGVMADGAIIESVNPYILVIMGQGITQHDADILFPKVSNKIFKIENDVQ